MPIVTIRYVEGPTAAQEQAVISSVTQAVVTHLAVPPEVVTVVLEPVPARRWATAGETLDLRLGL